jgi:hypothetical protein
VPGCGATFNALTGTRLARLRHPDERLLQAQVLDQGQTVVKAAGCAPNDFISLAASLPKGPRNIEAQPLTRMALAKRHRAWIIKPWTCEAVSAPAQ